MADLWNYCIDTIKTSFDPYLCSSRYWSCTRCKIRYAHDVCLKIRGNCSCTVNVFQIIVMASWQGLTVYIHYDDVIMDAIASQITSLTIVYSIIYTDVDQRKHQSSASLAFVWGIHRGPVNSPHKWPVTRKMFPFDDVIMSMAHWTGITSDNWHKESWWWPD